MSSESLLVAAVQLNSQADVAANLAAAREQVFAAAGAGARLILLPENFAFFGADEERSRFAEPPMEIGWGQSDSERPIQSALSQWSRELGVTLIGGGMPLASAEPHRPANSSLMFGPDGTVQARYDKIHLFDVSLSDGTTSCESAVTTPGHEVVVSRVEGFEVGLAICYDLRFPELFRAQSKRGATLLTLPAAFALHTGKDHWEVLLRARAIEAQAWVIAAAQHGVHPGGRTTYGRSMIVDPWGSVVAQCSHGVGFAMARISTDYLEQVRASVPSLRHRRLDP